MTTSPCPFCQPDADRCFLRNDLVYGIWDAYPASPGHALLVTVRHVTSWTETTPAERLALIEGIEVAQTTICERHQPTGFNIGLNLGEDAGQTIPHLHMHVIPRYAGDVSDPTGGVRNVIPGAGHYLDVSSATPPHGRALVAGGEEDPLLPHLIAHLADAERVDIAVAFTMRSGVTELFAHLQDVLERDGQVRIVTGDYRDVTEPEALLHLCDLSGKCELRVFETEGKRSFHPKAFIVYSKSGNMAFVGSSNLSRTALRTGVEWNYRVVTSRDQQGFASIASAFERLYSHSSVKELTPEWVKAYEARRRPTPAPDDSTSSELPPRIPEPHSIQKEALQALDAARAQGAGAGLVVLATGLGKTWLSAFDSNRAEFKRVLFVAHRDEILTQALGTFRRIRPNAKLGFFKGTEKATDADVLFASIQTLGKATHLRQFPVDAFDYIVVDEFHHASAATYRRLIEYFQPRFLLGLTATPERTDGGDLLSLCGENLIYTCDLVEGIKRGELSPFDYYGVPDVVDFSNIPWRNGKFDETELTNQLATKARAQNALEQYQRRAGARTLGFCVSQRHADFMAEFFTRAGIRTVAVHSGQSSAPRAHSLARLEDNELDIVFAVDMFNEGVDMPTLDTVMMLRPTESQILWLQQFGRGLRKAEGKRLKVIDYIGNHRSFLIKPRTLLGLSVGDEPIRQALRLLAAGEFELPPGCSVTYELEATDILTSLLRQSGKGDRLRTYYEDFTARNGCRPSAVEAYHDGYDPRAARPGHASWLAFVQFMNDLSPTQVEAVQEVGEFLESLEVTPMTKCFKMIVLLAMLEEGVLPGDIAVEALADRVRRLSRRYAVVRKEFGAALESDDQLIASLEKNPIAAWVGGKGTGQKSYFEYVGRRFRSTFVVSEPVSSALQELTREIVEWRLAVYSRRVSGMSGAERFTCKVFHSDGTPILKLPPRDRMAGLPTGWIDVQADGKEYQANFVRIAVNVLESVDTGENRLASVLRGWFGQNAGLPGTTNSVEFVRTDTGYLLQPVGAIQDEVLLWTAYGRSDIPPLFGMTFNLGMQQTGVISRDGVILLLVTLDKELAPEPHKYKDEFLSPTLFQWQSQSTSKRDSKIGRRISGHREQDIQIQLFVRPVAKVRGKAQPYFYAGPMDFLRWEGDQPFTVWYKLRSPVPKHLQAVLRVREHGQE